MNFLLAATSLLLVASTDAHAPKSGKGQSSENRLKKLEADFPCLGDFVNKTVVDQYVEKDNTEIQSMGLISELNGKIGVLGTFLKTEFGQGISKSEMKLICATKCEEVLDDCTIFRLTESKNAEGKIRFICYFYSDDSIAAQFPVVNPYKSVSNRSEGVEFRSSVFHRGEDLVLPDFQGCDVPVGKAGNLAVTCRLYQYLDAAPSECAPVLESLTSDFEDYIFPSVLCTYTELGSPAKLEQCLRCLANDAAIGCNSGSICDEDNVITKKCPDTCTSSGQTLKCKTCGNVCPQEESCVAKIQTALLCNLGSNPKFNQEEQLGSCMNSDIPGFPQFLADGGNGDFKCLNKTAVPDWV